MSISNNAPLSTTIYPKDWQGNWRMYSPVGYKVCKGIGYRGRIGIFKILPMTETMQKAIPT